MESAPPLSLRNVFEPMARDGLAHALGMVRGENMRDEHEFVLSPDLAVDWRMLIDEAAVKHSATILSQRTTMDGDPSRQEESSVSFQMLFLPHINKESGHTLGVVVMGSKMAQTKGSPVHRAQCFGRFCCNQETGETLVTMRPFGTPEAPSIDHIHWIDGPRGPYRAQRRSASFRCDPTLLKEADPIDSVLAGEICERETTDPCPECCPVTDLTKDLQGKCTLHQRVKPPMHAKDFSALRYNLSVHDGASIGPLSFWSAAGSGYKRSILFNCVGNDLSMRGSLLRMAHSCLLPTEVQYFPRPSPTFLNSMCAANSPDDWRERRGARHECPGMLSHNQPFLEQPIRVITADGQLLQQPLAVMNDSGSDGSAPETMVPGYAVQEHASGRRDIRIAPAPSQVAPEEAAYSHHPEMSAEDRRRFSNRRSAARSNERRMQYVATLAADIATAKKAVETAANRLMELQEEKKNLCRRLGR